MTVVGRPVPRLIACPSARSDSSASRIAADDVADVDEVARLFAVLEDDRGPPVEEPRREDRRHAGVRVRERLPGAVDVEEPQRHGGDAVRGPGDQRQLLVVALGDGVDRGGNQGLVLPGADPPELAAAGGAAGLPLACQQLPLRAWCHGHQAVLWALVLALAVDRHRGRHHQPLGKRALRYQLLQEDGGLHRVALGVAGDLVHRLTDADRGRQVDDAIHARERAGCGKAIADLPYDQLHRGRQVGVWSPWTCSSRESSTTTSSPPATSSRTRWLPMKPAPPVTNVLIPFDLPIVVGSRTATPADARPT